MKNNYTCIKRILIQGFKSYKDQTDLIEPFSPHCNVVVGRNGTGKSNFFFAIRFVMSDAYTNLRPEDRPGLIHESGGTTTMSAFVEIHFDNRDNRFPIDREEVILRRTIGLKKDEYFLDKKHVNKSDVINLLESAGFSRANPYYIVQQGKVNALTLMKDSERLELLNEVAGTRVYDDRREESTRIMAENNGKFQKIEDLFLHITQRLSELEGEKEELKAYQQLDKEKRSIEFSIYNKELQDAVEKLSEVERERAALSKKAGDFHDGSLKAHDEGREIEKQIKQLTLELQQLAKNKEIFEEEKQELIKLKANVALEVRDAEDKFKTGTEQTKRLQAELDKSTKTIDKKKEQLKKLKDDLQVAIDKEIAENQNLANSERRMLELYSKQGRTAQFKNKKERDAFLKEKQQATEKQIEDQKAQIKDVDAEVKKLRAFEKRMDGEVTDKRANLEEQRTYSDKERRSYEELRQKRDELANQRKELWKKESDVDLQIKSVKEELQKSEHQLQSSVSKSISAGIARINRICQANKDKIKGKVYGPLIELLEVNQEDSQFTTAIEVAAGGSLFHIVVDTDDTATAILDIMDKERATDKTVARVTFIPLNRVHVKESKLPEATKDMKPLIQTLKYDPKLKKAFAHVFGRTLLCGDLEVAGRYSRDGYNCVTPDGDQVSKKGSMTGGFHDVRHSKLKAMQNIREQKQKLRSISQDNDKVKTQVQEIENSITRTVSELQSQEAKRLQGRTTCEQLVLELQTMEKDLQSVTEQVAVRVRTSAELNQTLLQLRSSSEALAAEMKTDLQSKLSAAEEQELADLNKGTAELKKSALSLTESRGKLESDKNSLQQELNSNLLKRQDELRAELADTKTSDENTVLETRRQDFEKQVDQLKDITKNIEEADTGIQEKKSSLTKLKQQIETKKNEEAEQGRKLRDEAKGMEKLVNKRSVLLQKKEESTRKIRELGSLPADTENYREMPSRELMDKLKTVNSKLKGYSSVNKKALDQYVSFSDQKIDLQKRKTELEEGRKKISDLIDLLDRQKDEARDRTFKGVAKHFKDVFKELVPQGSGSLRITTEEDDSGKKKGIKYTGLSVRVSFIGDDEAQLMQQLSGGQKSLVALALIFAIQRADPAPFYLFDEVDSALDDEYRSSVAAVIKKQSETTQFIISTFRPELVHVADKFYGISFKQDVSKIAPISQAAALDLVSQDAPQQAGDENKEKKDKEPGSSRSKRAKH